MSKEHICLHHCQAACCHHTHLLFEQREEAVRFAGATLTIVPLNTAMFEEQLNARQLQEGVLYIDIESSPRTDDPIEGYIPGPCPYLTGSHCSLRDEDVVSPQRPRACNEMYVRSPFCMVKRQEMGLGDLPAWNENI